MLPDAQQEGTLSGPVPAGAAAVVLASQHYRIQSGLLVLLGGVIHVERGAGGQVEGAGAGLGHQLVDEADVAERPPGHHGIVPSPRAERVEVPGVEAAGGEVAGGGGVARDGAGRRDVVRGHAVTQVQQHRGAPGQVQGSWSAAINCTSCNLLIV